MRGAAMPEDAKTDAQAPKPMTLREVKQLVSARLRDPKTDTKSVTRLLSFMAKYGFKRRKPRNARQTVNDLVQDLEARDRKARVH